MFDLHAPDISPAHAERALTTKLGIAHGFAINCLIVPHLRPQNCNPLRTLQVLQVLNTWPLFNASSTWQLIESQCFMLHLLPLPTFLQNFHSLTASNSWRH